MQKTCFAMPFMILYVLSFIIISYAERRRKDRYGVINIVVMEMRSKKAARRREDIMVRKIKFCMAGFGNVGKAFARLLLEKKAELAAEYGCEMLLTGVCTRSGGALVNADGLSFEKVLKMNERKERFAGCKNFADGGVPEMISASGAEIFLELTTLSAGGGEPAAGYIRQALNSGMHVITSNKGPEAWCFDELNALAKKNGRLFLYESSVMGGAPLFSLVRHSLRGNRIVAVKGILNATTNFLLGELEKGADFGAALKEAQRMGIAEADPSADINGLDGAAKICVLANILMNASVNPGMTYIKSLAGVSAADLEAARGSGRRIKFICRAERDESGAVKTSVKPENLCPDDPLANAGGSSTAVTLYTDLAGELSVVHTDPGIMQTAYGVYSDLLTVLEAAR